MSAGWSRPRRALRHQNEARLLLLYDRRPPSERVRHRGFERSVHRDPEERSVARRCVYLVLKRLVRLSRSQHGASTFIRPHLNPHHQAKPSRDYSTPSPVYDSGTSLALPHLARGCGITANRIADSFRLRPLIWNQRLLPALGRSLVAPVFRARFIINLGTYHRDPKVVLPKQRNGQLHLAR
jgi:hypothetical protein